MKYLITILCIASFTSIVFGIATRGDNSYAEKCIGFGTVGLFFVVMPLFIFTRSKGKDIKNYMLTKENILKMKDVSEKKKL